MQDKKDLHFQFLLDRYKAGNSTPDEVRELFDLIGDDDFDHHLETELQKEFDVVFRKEKSEGPTDYVHWIKKYFLPVAASVSIFICVYVFFLQNTAQKSKNLVQTQEERILPGSDQAILTYNGRSVRLDSTSAGNVAEMNGTLAMITKEGELTLESPAQATGEPLINNKLTTPTGGFFKITLSDGTIVWLNSESELTFPSRFEGEERVVSLLGEGYFEVSYRPDQPFRVQLQDKKEITVYGTSFNVMAYENEPFKKVTLIDGRITVSDGNGRKNLKPNEQAIFEDGEIKTNREVFVEHEIAWKNGLFDFQNENLSAVLRQISRWYHVEIDHSMDHRDSHYTGSIRRSSDIKDVLRMLEIAGDVKFSVVGKKIIVNGK